MLIFAFSLKIFCWIVNYVLRLRINLSVSALSTHYFHHSLKLTHTILELILLIRDGIPTNNSFLILNTHLIEHVLVLLRSSEQQIILTIIIVGSLSSHCLGHWHKPCLIIVKVLEYFRKILIISHHRLTHNWSSCSWRSDLESV